jgi:hypothetical protein
MQFAEDGITGHGTNTQSLNGPRFRRILLQPKMCSRLVVVGQILLQHSPKMLLAQHDHIVETFTPDRSDGSLVVAMTL